MILYEYRCPRGHRHEEFHEMRDCMAETICPRCGERARRILSTPYLVGMERSEGCFRNLETPLGRRFTNSRDVDRFLRKTKTVRG